MPFEDLGQVALIRESACRGDLSKRHLPLFEQELCSLDTMAQDKLVRACSSGLTEQAGKVIRTKASLLRQCLQ